MKLIFVSTPVGSLGSGVGGGVELSLYNAAQEMLRRGHQLQAIAPANSTRLDLPIVQIPGNYQPMAQNQERTEPIIMPENPVIANMWEYVRQVQDDCDLIVNFAYDWLPFYLTPFFRKPIAHLVSMGSLTNAIDQIIPQIVKQFPGTVAFRTKTQAQTFGIEEECCYLSNGIDLSLYNFCPEPKKQLAWLGRIAPEKGLEDAVAAAQITNIPLKIMGRMQDNSYWEKICSDYPDAPIEYLGFLSTDKLQQVLRECQGLLMTHRWVEAFGNVVIESLACGVPVISYRRGGPAETIQDGVTGFLVEPDSVPGLVEAIARIDEIKRYTCRQEAESKFSVQALGDRFENWLYQILKIQ